MRELIALIRFTNNCLGNVRKFYWKGDKKFVYFAFDKDHAGNVIFMPKWWRSNMSFASTVLSKHQDEIGKMCFDPVVDGIPRGGEQCYRRYYDSDKFTRHETFAPGDIVGVKAAVPTKISDEDFRALMAVTGQYKGISPYKPYQFGFFTVENISTP